MPIYKVNGMKVTIDYDVYEGSTPSSGPDPSSIERLQLFREDGKELSPEEEAAFMTSMMRACEMTEEEVEDKICDDIWEEYTQEKERR